MKSIVAGTGSVGALPVFYGTFIQSLEDLINPCVAALSIFLCRNFELGCLTSLAAGSGRRDSSGECVGSWQPLMTVGPFNLLLKVLKC
jgi:hypothetical protein